jgi:hypothetical protein
VFEYRVVVMKILMITALKIYRYSVGRQVFKYATITRWLFPQKMLNYILYNFTHFSLFLNIR